MRYSYRTENTCSREIRFDLNGDVVSNVEFLGGGCPGNLQALPRLVEGMTVFEIEEKLGGIICGGRGTSCANELVKAVKVAYQKSVQQV